MEKLAIPDALLVCAPAPVPPSAAMQSEVADYIADLWAAGDDCREKLNRVGGIVNANP